MGCDRNSIAIEQTLSSLQVLERIPLALNHPLSFRGAP